MSKLGDRIKDAKHWAHHARVRFLGARHNLRECRAEIEAINKRLETAQGGVKEDLLARRKEQGRRKQKLAYQSRHRFKVWRHCRKKLKHLRKVKQERQRENESPATGSTSAVGFGTFDGKTVAAWMVPWLVKSRAAGWHGVVVSGVRTPAYSQQLCYNMCGHPTCPGTCAGIYSNHNMLPSQGYPYGALDVSDYYTFESVQFRIGSPLRNDLPADPVHFSVSGH